MIRCILLVSVFASVAACSSDPTCADCTPFATFQECYNDHHVTSGFTPDRAIEICCIDHPIGNAAMNVVCGDTTQSCMTYVTANVTDAADTMLTADITSACTNYPHDSGRAGG
jgi:hypothetical protein